MKHAIEPHAPTTLSPRPTSQISVADQIYEHLRSGESEYVEFKERIADASVLARNIGALANADSGTILVGVREPNHIVGCDMAAVSIIYHAARRMLHPQPTTAIKAVPFGDKIIAMITVDKSPEIVASDGGFYRRTGEKIVPVSAEEIARRLGPSRTEDQFRLLVEGLASQSQQIILLERRIAAGETLPSRMKNEVRAGVIGVVIAAVLNVDRIVEFLTHLAHRVH